jgi:hypothetical protein
MLSDTEVDDAKEIIEEWIDDDNNLFYTWSNQLLMAVLDFINLKDRDP